MCPRHKCPPPNPFTGKAEGITLNVKLFSWKFLPMKNVPNNLEIKRETTLYNS